MHTTATTTRFDTGRRGRLMRAVHRLRRRGLRVCTARELGNMQDLAGELAEKCGFPRPARFAAPFAAPTRSDRSLNMAGMKSARAASPFCALHPSAL